MGDSKQPVNVIAQALLILGVFGSPSTFGIILAATQNPTQALLLAALVAVAGFGGRLIIPIYLRYEARLIENTDQEIQRRRRDREDKKFEQPYLEYLIYRHRAFDVKGLSTQGPFALELEKVFVDLSISPEAQPLSNPIPASNELRQGGHTIFDWLKASNHRHLVIVGAPGSGKTTLLKFLTLTLANPPKKAKSTSKLPVLLFLRDHAQSIDENSKVPLAALIYNSLEYLQQKTKAPESWFEKHLNQGNCLVMLDGLDEIGNASTRKKVVDWVQEQLAVYGKNRFIITSRPHGYRSNPLNDVTLLEVRPFNRTQVELFVYNWYLANEMMSYQKYDPGVEMEARRGADDLMKRIRNAPDIAELAVNPLLLTMIANVHRYRSSLPGRRVELYAEMCDVFLGKSDQSKPNLIVELTPAQKQSVLQPLAYHMMHEKRREIDLEEALAVITEPLAQVSSEITGKAFIELVRDRSGILVERENEAYGFSHKTFQEFLAATHIQQEKLHDELIQYIDDDWWHEVIRLYCAREDATPIISACLAGDSLPILRLILAIECSEEALKVDPEVRKRIQRVIDIDVDSEDPARRQIAGEALWALRLRRLTRVDDNTYVDSTPISYAEYFRFLEARKENKPYHWDEGNFPLDEGKRSMIGVPSHAIHLFYQWLTHKEANFNWFFRPPNQFELDTDDCWYLKEAKLTLDHKQTMNLSDWLMTTDRIKNQNLQLVEVSLQEYNLEWDSIIVLALDITHNHTRISANAITSARAVSLANALDIVNTSAVSNARVLAAALARTLVGNKDYISAHVLASALASASPLTSDLDRGCNLAKILNELWTVNNQPLLKLFYKIAQLITAYIALEILIQDGKYGFAVQTLQSLERRTWLRGWLLEQVETHYEQQPRKFGNNQEWEKWKAKLDNLLQAYAFLATIERQRTGEWEPFGTLRIVKERRKD